MILDKDKLRKYADFFRMRVQNANKHLDRIFPSQTIFDFQSGVDFLEGFLQMEEGYKNYATWNREQYLHLSSWDDKAIQDGTVAREIRDLIYDDKLDNLIDWRDKQYFKTLLEDESKRTQLGNCIRRIFCGNDDEAGFKGAQKYIGNRFPIISFLYFIKNPERYLPVRPNNFADKLQSIGITGWNSSCSWDNYDAFISAIKEVQDFIKEYFNDKSISLLDAHSFVWMAWMEKDSVDNFLAKIEKHCKTELRRIRKQYNTPKGCANEAERIEYETQSLKGKEKEAVVRVRANQGVFRSLLLERYNKCCLCQISNRGLLLASHIKPWSASASTEKLDWNNGFLMCPNHDKLFDKGFISFQDDGSIMISDNLSEINRLSTNVRSDMSIKLTEGNKRYLQYHREKVFQGIQFPVE